MKQIRLGFSMRGLGYHNSAWRDPAVPADGPIDMNYYLDMARTAERGLFDMLFIADHSALPSPTIPGVLGRTSHDAGEFEPLTFLGALSMLTTHIGMVATASTTFHHPFQLARQFASLDQLSQGRVGWNVVTSSRDEEARNFGSDRIIPRAQRYARARESLEVAFALWNSWDEDAFPRDKQTGVYFDPAKMHPVDHTGECFRVRGVLTVPRSKQGRPVIVQAGASDDGIDFAASVADVVYSVQTNLADAKSFYQRVKSSVASHGRDPDHLKIMPGLLPIIGSSRAEAEDRLARMREELDPLIGLYNIAPYFGDLSSHDLDGPVPELRTDRPVISRGQLTLKLARDNGWSIRQLFQSTAIGNGHHVVAGTPSDIVDVMTEWFEGGAADGFNILPAKSPQSLRMFVDHVVPELQLRALYRTAYEASTLRGNLGLPLPA
jgi:alkanesulfonate monooxygenase